MHYLSGISIQKGDVGEEDSTNPLNLLNIMLRKIILVDYSSREISNVIPSIESETPSASDDFWDALNEESVIENKQIHPMDVFLFLYLSIDPLFQRKVLQKLDKCKLSLPLIINDPSTCQPKIFAFPFQSLSSEWKKDSKNEKAKESILFNEPMPIISFIRFGNHSSDKFSKSKILNDILGFDHDCFIHCDSQGSTKSRLLFDGTVEISWFLPKRGVENKFANPIAFLNLRGDASQHPKQLNFIQLVSNKIFLILWSENLRDYEIEPLREMYARSGSKIVCLLPSFTLETKKLIQSCPNSKGDSQHVVMLGKGNWAADIVSLSRLVNLHSQDPSEKVSSLSEHIHRDNHGLAVDRNELYFKETDVETDLYTRPLLLDSDKYGTKALRHIKDTHLMLQGKPWEDWSKHFTEGYRLKEWQKGSLEEYRSELRTQMNDCRDSQMDVLNNINNMKFLYEILKLCRFSFVKPFYSELFWNKLQLSLDMICAKHLPSLYEEHNVISNLKNIRGHVQSNPSSPYANLTHDQLKAEYYKSARNLTKSSLGMEHVIRELAQVYEAYSAASNEQKHTLDPKMPICLDNLPIFAANFLLQGYPLEILDGDVSHVPSVWLSRVLEHLKSIIGNKLIYIVSILGVQSSGKSTLLNTMFGLHFAVSAGRCTKGIFMQMIPVSPDLTEHLGYDYLVILDTEGLRAPEFDSDITRFHDNELTTFAIGLSHLTIINIYGENPTEMEDILQITVNAFLRMNLTWIKPRCIFVHQNVTSVGCEEKLAPIRNALISKLNEMTEEAAKHESMNYRYFSDLIHFNPEEDVFYFPGLYLGTPPMAPINVQYSLESAKLKSIILKMFIQFPDMKSKKISAFAANIQQLWKAILHENFIFHFKNIQEVNAQRELDYVLTEWYYGYSQLVYEWLIAKFANLSNMTNITITIHELEKSIQRLCAEKYQDEQSRIIHDFFKVKEKAKICGQWESRTKDHFEDSRRALQKEVQTKCCTEYNLIMNQSKLSKKIGEIESSLVVKVKEFLKTVKNSKNIDNNSINSTFELFWKQCLNTLNIQQQEITRCNIPADLYEYFNSLSWFTSAPSKFLERLRDWKAYIKIGKNNCMFYKTHVKIHCDHSLPNDFYPSLANALTKRNHSDLDYSGKRIYWFIFDHLTNISKECKHFISQLPRKTAYNKNYFGELNRHISTMIDSINEEERYANHITIRFTDNFKRDQMFYHCCKAIPDLMSLQDSYIRGYCVQTQLTDLRERYFQTFSKSVKTSISEKACSEHLSDIVLDGMRRYLVSILNKLAVDMFLYDNQEIVRSKGTIQLTILKGFVDNNRDFSKYLNYIRNPDKCMNTWFRTQYIEYSKRDTSLRKIQNSIMTQVNQFLDCYTEAAKSCKSMRTWHHWKVSFLSKISLRVYSLRFEHLIVLDTYDVSDFDQLYAFFREDIHTRCKDFDWKQWMKSKLSETCEPLKQVMNTKLECIAMCPFCREPCQLSVGNHEKHYCGSLHRVDAVNGGREYPSGRMFAIECTISVRDGRRFIHNGESYSYSDMNKAGPPYSSWNILADDACESKYWQWFTYKFENNLVKHYGYKSHPDVRYWRNITKQQVLQDLNEHYQQFNV